MAHGLVLGVWLAAMICGCGSSSSASSSVAVKTASGYIATAEGELGAAGPPTIEVATPSAVVRAGGRQLAEFELGRAVAAQSGCLACHRIGAEGNDGPGRDLTHIGSLRSAREIEHAIVAPTEPMPSFRNLPRAKLAALVAFLSVLRR